MKKIQIITIATIIGFLMFFTSCKKTVSYNINGEWVLTIANNVNMMGTCTFSGTEISGTAVYNYNWNGDTKTYRGTYSVTDNSVTIFMSIEWSSGITYTLNLTGEFTSENNMNGKSVYNVAAHEYEGTWTATRGL